MPQHANLNHGIATPVAVRQQVGVTQEQHFASRDAGSTSATVAHGFAAFSRTAAVISEQALQRQAASVSREAAATRQTGAAAVTDDRTFAERLDAGEVPDDANYRYGYESTRAANSANAFARSARARVSEGGDLFNADPADVHNALREEAAAFRANLPPEFGEVFAFASDEPLQRALAQSENQHGQRLVAARYDAGRHFVSETAASRQLSFDDRVGVVQEFIDAEVEAGQDRGRLVGNAIESFASRAIEDRDLESLDAFAATLRGPGGVPVSETEDFAAARPRIAATIYRGQKDDEFVANMETYGIVLAGVEDGTTPPSAILALIQKHPERWDGTAAVNLYARASRNWDKAPVAVKAESLAEARKHLASTMIVAETFAEGTDAGGRKTFGIASENKQDEWTVTDPATGFSLTAERAEGWPDAARAIDQRIEEQFPDDLPRQRLERVKRYAANHEFPEDIKQALDFVNANQTTFANTLNDGGEREVPAELASSFNIAAELYRANPGAFNHQLGRDAPALAEAIEAFDAGLVSSPEQALQYGWESRNDPAVIGRIRASRTTFEEESDEIVHRLMTGPLDSALFGTGISDIGEQQIRTYLRQRQELYLTRFRQHDDAAERATAAAERDAAGLFIVNGYALDPQVFSNSPKAGPALDAILRRRADALGVKVDEVTLIPTFGRSSGLRIVKLDTLEPFADNTHDLILSGHLAQAVYGLEAADATAEADDNRLDRDEDRLRERNQRIRSAEEQFEPSL